MFAYKNIILGIVVLIIAGCNMFGVTLVPLIDSQNNSIQGYSQNFIKDNSFIDNTYFLNVLKLWDEPKCPVSYGFYLIWIDVLLITCVACGVIGLLISLLYNSSFVFICLFLYFFVFFLLNCELAI